MADTAFGKAKTDETVFTKAEADLKPPTSKDASAKVSGAAPADPKQAEQMKKPIAWLHGRTRALGEGQARSTGSSRARLRIWQPEAMGEAQSPQPVATPAVETLEAELARIAALGLDEVRTLWREMTQRNAPKALSRDLLARMIAHRVQEQRLGKLGREMRKLLDRLVRGPGEPVRHLKVGTVMVREHQGTLHEVMVVPGGFSWQDKTYRASAQRASVRVTLPLAGTPALRLLRCSQATRST
jgi:Protein of unknown function (DUF2924)